MDNNKSSNNDRPLLVVRELETSFDTDGGIVRAASGVSFRLHSSSTFALVGESGCGKSVTSLSIMGLVPSPPGRVNAETIALDGENLLAKTEKQMQQLRGNDIAMIFQEPMISLNPVFTIGRQMSESARLHLGVSRAEALDMAHKMLENVGIPEPLQRLREYPHQLSGGMCQRVMIAMALMCSPKLLIADEPTTALDVTIQAQILELLDELSSTGEMGILLITHDLGVVAECADVVAVMYAGKIVELASVAELFDNPQHPYTQGLFRSIPKLGSRIDRLETITGMVPHLADLPAGCSFSPRCDKCGGSGKCLAAVPELREISPGHWSACYKCDSYDSAIATNPADSDAAYANRSLSRD